MEADEKEMSNGVNIDRLKRRIRTEEGLVLRPYRCPAGRRTIGYGWNLDARKLPEYIDFHLMENGEITEEMAEYLLDVAVSEAVEAARRYTGDEIWRGLTPARREVLADMAYNLGEGGLMRFETLRRCLKMADYDGASQAMRNSKWYRQVGERARSLSGVMMTGNDDDGRP